MKEYALVIDRSTETQSVALAETSGDGWTLVAERTLEGLGCRGGEWAERVRAFLADRLGPDAKPARIVVGTGPGSFAGIRAALAFAQGYAIGSGCEVLGLPSPCAYADEGPLAVVGDARRGLRWVALFDGCRLVTDIFQVAADTLESRVPRFAKVTSPDDARLGAELKEAFGDRYDGGRAPTAAGLVRFVARNPSAPVREPLPIYLNPAVRDAPEGKSKA